MGKRPKRQIILFLVEGKSDREALKIAISEMYEQINEDIEVFFPVIHDEQKEKGGDITSSFYKSNGKREWVTPENIEEEIYSQFLCDFFDKEKILPKDVSEIIQIVDADGAFIPDDKVRTDHKLGRDKSPFYGLEEITCISEEAIQKRNTQKKANLDYLSKLTSIKVKQKTIKYSIYYFSCNLDHFFHHDANESYRKKINLARQFAYDYIGDAEGFVKFIARDEDAVREGGYDGSWEYVKQGTNSLHRHTNFNLLLEKLLKNTRRLDP